MFLRTLESASPQNIAEFQRIWGPTMAGLENARTAGNLLGRERARVLLREIGRLEPDWDGYGALPISKAVLGNALQLVDVVESQHPNLPNPEISPKSNGTISMEWESMQGEAYLEIGNSRFSFFIRSKFDERFLRDGDAGSIDSDLLTVVERVLYSPVSYSATFNRISIGV